MLIGSDDATGYEANLSLTLPADAVVTGYALDVGGRMIPRQLLEAPKARNVYEAGVRTGIDPGLAEIAGNRFTPRIFPIDAAHRRRLRLTFVAVHRVCHAAGARCGDRTGDGDGHRRWLRR